MSRISKSLGSLSLTLLIMTLGTLSSGADTTTPASTGGASLKPTLESRLVVDSGGCPRALEVWLHNTSDTIQGAEIVLNWDRPDYARFQSDTTGIATSRQSAVPEELRDKGTAGAPRPVIDRSRGLLKTWDYVEARGTAGLSVKVTALAYLVAASSAQLVPPLDSGLLFTLPVELPGTPPMVSAADSTSVRVAIMQTRLSTNHGNLVANLQFRESKVPVANCTSSSSPRR